VFHAGTVDDSVARSTTAFQDLPKVFNAWATTGLNLVIARHLIGIEAKKLGAFFRTSEFLLCSGNSAID
jgi:hypothetical protein